MRRVSDSVVSFYSLPVYPTFDSALPLSFVHILQQMITRACGNLLKLSALQN